MSARFVSRMRLAAFLLLALVVGVPAVALRDTSAAAAQTAAAGPSITHGVASGDVAPTSALVWARGSRPGRLRVQVGRKPRISRRRPVRTAVATAASDFAATIKLTGLKPSTRYYYRAWFKGGRAQQGTFMTAPSARTRRPLRFIFAGDLGGQKFCRRPEFGYSFFTHMRDLKPDFMVANGDFIYGDHDCPEDGPDGPGGWQNIPGDFPGAADPAVDWTNLPLLQEIYVKHWRYNRADPRFQDFLRRVPIYSQWDDHEVINDFGAAWTYWTRDTAGRAGYSNLVTAGRRAFFAYGVLGRNRSEPNRIYRSFRWGKDVELFIVDARSYRSRDDLRDTPENAKTMLGAAQLAWLERRLRRSKATWKIVSSDVTLSVATGNEVIGRDGWANGGAGDPSTLTGFERELLGLLRDLDAANVKNLVFLATDVHHPLSLRYEGDFDGDRDTLLFHEFISGPLSAQTSPPRVLDPTLNPQRLFQLGNVYNFGFVRVAREGDRKVHLVEDVRDLKGVEIAGSLIDLSPQ